MSEALSPGDFYLFCPKTGGLGASLFGSLGRTVSFGRSSSLEKATQERIDALIRQSNKTSVEKDKLVDVRGSLAASTWNPSPSTWSLGSGAALVVYFGLFEVIGDLRRVQPSVYHDADHSVVSVFQGYLTNLDELIERYCEPSKTSSSSPTAVLESGRDPREMAAEVVYRMYARGDDPLVLLSELQGQFSFVMYNGDRRQIFVARDSSGKEPLYYNITDDGAVSVSNSLLSVPSPEGVGVVEWEELPPGHFVAGKPPKLQQFALTPAQLTQRELDETAEDELSPRASSRKSLELVDDFADIGILE